MTALMDKEQEQGRAPPTPPNNSDLPLGAGLVLEPVVLDAGRGSLTGERTVRATAIGKDSTDQRIGMSIASNFCKDPASNQMGRTTVESSLLCRTVSLRLTFTPLPTKPAPLLQ